MARPSPKALLFDIFGTCVDWRTTVTKALSDQAHASLNSPTASLPTTGRLRASSLVTEDWGNFAQQWRDSYKNFVVSLATNPDLPWQTVDEHHLEALNRLVTEWKLGGLWSEEELQNLNLIWHQLDPWTDSGSGIVALNALSITATLSNGNLDLLNDLKKHAELDFTHVFSAEQFEAYKPSPKVYLGAVEKLGLKPNECAMVAAHLGDLKAAKAAGLQAFYIERPQEEDWDAAQIETARKEGWVDIWVPVEKDGFIALADLLSSPRLN